MRYERASSLSFSLPHAWVNVNQVHTILGIIYTTCMHLKYFGIWFLSHTGILSAGSLEASTCLLIQDLYRVPYWHGSCTISKTWPLVNSFPANLKDLIFFPLSDDNFGCALASTWRNSLQLKQCQPPVRPQPHRVPFHVHTPRIRSFGYEFYPCLYTTRIWIMSCGYHVLRIHLLFLVSDPSTSFSSFPLISPWDFVEESEHWWN